MVLSKLGNPTIVTYYAIEVRVVYMTGGILIYDVKGLMVCFVLLECFSLLERCFDVILNIGIDKSFATLLIA